MNYVVPSLETYGHVAKLTSVVDGTYGSGPPEPPGSVAGGS